MKMSRLVVARSQMRQALHTPGALVPARQMAAVAALVQGMSEANLPAEGQIFEALAPAHQTAAEPEPAWEMAAAPGLEMAEALEAEARSCRMDWDCS